MPKRYIVAEVHGMCGGVFAALDKLEKMIIRHPDKTVFVLHELVHNTAVTGDFEKRGVRFVDSLSDIPAGAPVVIGAHGVSGKTEGAIRAIAGDVMDATCPLVRKLHQEASRLTPNEQLVIFGKKDHPEVIGVYDNSGAGSNFVVYSPEDIALLPPLDSPVFISQTTVDSARCDEIREVLNRRFPNLRCVAGVCDASKKRQSAVLRLLRECQMMIVAGSAHSSNACRLKEVAEQHGVPAYLVNGAEDLPESELAKFDCIGITSGASTPEHVLEKIISRLQKIGFSS